jgi:hypothetical protein
VQILGNVETINANAFDSATALTMVTLPASLKSIGAEAFKNAISLKEITIPSGLVNLAANSFDAGRFTTINYYGPNSSVLNTLKTLMSSGLKVNTIDPNNRDDGSAAAKEAAAKARAEAEAKAAREKAEALQALQKYAAPEIKKPFIVVPTVETYKIAGITGVTLGNLELVNQLVGQISPEKLNAVTMNDAVKVANLVVKISKITFSSDTIIKKSELAVLAIDDIAPRHLHSFTTFVATLPSNSRDTPSEIEAAAVSFKANQSAELQRIKKIREEARADLLARIAAAFK